jgi:hypothetical protein
VNQVLIRIQAELGSLKQELQAVKASVQDATGTMKGAFEGMGASAAKIGLAISGVRQVIGTISSLTAPLQWASRAAAEFESLRTRLDSLYLSAKVGGEVFDELVKVAKTTPFELRDIVEAGVTMKAFGVDAKETTKDVANLAAFMGESATLAAASLGRAWAGGVAAADILRERGILALVKSFKGIDDLTKLTLPQFREALISTLRDPAAGITGSTDKLAKTFSGTISNMKDSLSLLGNEIGTALNPTTKTLAEMLMKASTNMTGFIKSFNSDPIKETEKALEKLNARTEGLVVLQQAQARLQLSEKQHDLSEALDDYGKGALDAASASATLEARQREILTLQLQIGQSLANQQRGFSGRNLLFDWEGERSGFQDRIKMLTKEVEELEPIVRLYEEINGLRKAAGEVVGTTALGMTVVVDRLNNSVDDSVVTFKEYLEEARKRAQSMDAEDDNLFKLIIGYPALAEKLGIVTSKLKELKGLPKLSDWLSPKTIKPGLVKEVTNELGDFVKEAEKRAAMMDKEQEGIAFLIEHYPLLAKKLGYVKTQFEGFAGAARGALKDMLDDAEFWRTSLMSAFSSMGDAMANAWLGNLGQMRAALKQMLTGILEAIHAEVLGAEVSMVAKAFVKGGSFNPAAGIASLLTQLPAIAGIEAMFAAFRAAVTKFEHGGVISRPTLALMGEAVHRSGPEIVAPERSFKQWATDVLVPLVAERGGASAAVEEKLDRIEAAILTALNPDRFGRAVGRQLAVSTRGLL